jgi:S1-C subfamily serine protease
MGQKRNNFLTVVMSRNWLRRSAVEASEQGRLAGGNPWGVLSAIIVLALGNFAALPAAPEVDIRRDPTVAAIEKVMPSVVNIATSVLVRRPDDPYEVFRRRYYGLPPEPDVKEKINSVGSGVIIDQYGDEAYILTNLHVVDGASRVQVQLMDGRVFDAEQLLGTSRRDLALLRIVRPPGDKGFDPIRFAQDDDLLLGETVITAGNPFGLGGSVSRGILSSKNRRPIPGTNQPLGFEDWLQTDADINAGNSGGPLVNLRGELIGINVAVYNEGEGKGTGFSIPVKQISAALSDFFTLEYTSGLWFGARIKGGPRPLTVREVQTNGPAFKAGLRVGQRIAEVNGRPVTGLVEFNKLVAGSPNRLANITVLDQGELRKLRVEMRLLADLNGELLQKRLGLSTQPLTEAQAGEFRIKPGDGLLVREVEKGGPAGRARIQAGIVLAGVDGVGINDLVNVANVLGNKKSGEGVQLGLILPRRLTGGAVELVAARVNVPAR